MKTIENRRVSGFSLIELMIALAIFGVLLALALPSFRQWTTDTQVRNYTAYIMSGLQKAKTEAISHNYNVRFQLVSSIADGCSVVATGNEWIVSHGNPALAPNGGCARDAMPGLIALRDNNNPASPTLLAALNEADLDGDGTAGPSADVDGDGAIGTVPINTVVPILLVKGFRENQSNVQATMLGLTPATGAANPNISNANQVICFNGSGQLMRILQGAVNNGACTTSSNPATTERVAFRITVSAPTAGTCTDAGGDVRCLRIQVSPTGDIRSCDPAVSDANDPRRCL